MTYSTEFLEGFLRKPDKPSLSSGILMAPGTQGKSTQSILQVGEFLPNFQMKKLMLSALKKLAQVPQAPSGSQDQNSGHC